MEKVIIYLNITDEEYMKDKNILEKQIELVKKHADKKYFTIVKIFYDIRTSSDNDLKERSGLIELLTYIKSNPIHKLIIPRYDTISENLFFYFFIEKELKKYHIELTPLIKTNPNQKKSSFKILDKATTVFAKFENIINKNIDNKHGIIKSTKISKHLPFGYVYDENNNIVIDKEIAILIKVIFHKFLDGNNYREIALSLDDTSPIHITPRKVSSILKDRTYTGLVRFDDMEIANIVPPIISFEVFNKVQDILKKKK